MSLTHKYYLTSAVASENGDDPGMTISTMDIDREGDSVIPEGANLSNYLKNPVLVWSHDYHNIPIGAVTQLEVVPGQGLKAQWKWLQDDPFADRIKNAWDQGIVRASSIGFIAHDVEPNTTGGRDIKAWEMLELSLCAIPMNPSAVRSLKGVLDAGDVAANHVQPKKQAVIPPAWRKKTIPDTLASLKQYVDSYAERAEYDETPDIQGVTAAINLLQCVAAHELAEEEAHASLIRDAVTLLITFLQQEFLEQFGGLDVDEEAVTPPLRVTPQIPDPNAGGDKDEPTVDMDPDQYPYVSVSGLGEGHLVEKKVFDALMKAKLPKAQAQKLHDAHAHVKAAASHINDVLTTTGHMSGLQTDKPAGSGSTTTTHQPAKDIDLDAITYKATDQIDISASDLRAALAAVMPDLLRTEIEQATTAAVNRARGRLN